MATGDDSVRFCSDLLAGFADTGVRTVFISPGSRNTPLTLAAVAEPRIIDHSVRDERSAGFMALGVAKRSGVPAIVVCTSGSAAAHYLPAIVEADQSGTPMIVVTSDRPPHLRGTGAPQTMDQIDLYGRHVKAFADVYGHADPRGVASSLAWEAADGVPGPVHVNVPFDEPLVPTQRFHPPEPKGVVDHHVEPSTVPSDLFDQLAGRKVMIVAGGHHGERFRNAVEDAAQRLGAPILADPQSAVSGDHVIRRADLVAGADDGEGRPFAIEAAAPDVVLRLGPIPTSKPLWRWMEVNGLPQILIHNSRLADPLGSATTTIPGDPAAILELAPIPRGNDEYVARWRDLDRTADRAMRDAIATLDFPNEPAVARIVSEGARSGSILWVASSRPIRDLDAFGVLRPDLTVLANRGVNGIDGTISSAIGAALDGFPTTLLIGDIAFLHDATAVAEAVSLGVPLRIVVVNNDGGGIFSFLPQASTDLITPNTYERHWGTPHGLAIAPIASSLGMAVRTVTTSSSLSAAVASAAPGPELIEVVVDRDRVVADHTVVRQAVAEALATVVR